LAYLTASSGVRGLNALLALLNNPLFFLSVVCLESGISINASDSITHAGSRIFLKILEKI